MRIYLVLIFAVVFASCVRNKSGQVVQNVETTNEKSFEVVEVLQANSYSYLRVKEDFNEKWVAVGKDEFKVGDVLFYDSEMKMTNFPSKDLDRTFEEVYFVNQVSKTPFVQSAEAMPAHSGRVELKEESEVEVTKNKGELTVAELFAKRADYSTKEFEIKGIVVKVNKNVMGKNWIHIQDGTSDNGEFDLTITSQDQPEVGSEVTFKGKLTLNKDFGAGYSYEVIMEDAVLVSKQAAEVQL